jgi:ankyrin repeat protein
VPDIADLTASTAAGDLATIRAILAEAPVLLNAPDGEGATALHYAAFCARQDVVRWLVSQGADINARDNRFGATPTGWAIEYLRELGGCLGMEMEDVLVAIQQGDVVAEAISRPHASVSRLWRRPWDCARRACGVIGYTGGQGVVRRGSKSPDKGIMPTRPASRPW